MKMLVESKKFAECMKKILPAVEITKDKKGSTESSIQLMLTKRKLEDGYFGIAVAYDGKKQLFCVFCANELEMEEDKKEIYISGKRLCDISAAMDNGKEVPMSLEVDKCCVLKKGGSQVQIPLGEKPVIIYPSNDWYVKTKVSTTELLNLLSKGGRFYNPGMDTAVADVCFCFNLEQGKLQVSSTDVYKMGLFGMDVKLDYGKAMEKLQKQAGKTEAEDASSEEDAENTELPPTFCMEENRLKIQIDGEQLKVLSRFLDPRAEETEICVYEKYLYFKSNADIALFLLKDVSEKHYPFEGMLGIVENHSREGSIHAAPKDILDALTVFDVANQESEPHVYITKDKSGAICFSTKGKLSKTLLPCEIKGEFKDMILNSVIFRQVMSSYEKEETVTIYTGKPDESVVVTDKEECGDFCIITKVAV